MKVAFVLVFCSILALSQGFLPVIAAAVPVIQSVLSMFKTESSTKFGELQNQKGFKDLDTHTEMGSGSVRRENLHKLFALWVQTLPLGPTYKVKLTQFMQGAEWEEFLDPYSSLTQDFKFSDGNGGIYYFKAVLQLSQDNPDIIKWEKVLWSAKFTVAPPFCIVTKSKSSFFSSSVKDEVRYFQATLNPEHLAALRDLAIPFMFVQSPEGQTLIDRQQ